MLDLIPLAENVTKITAVCVECYQNAAFTKRIAKSHEVELIGGTERYLKNGGNLHITKAKNPFFEQFWHIICNKT